MNEIKLPVDELRVGFESAVKQAGTAFAGEIPMRIGNPENGSIYANEEKTLVYVHTAGDEPGGMTTIPASNIPINKRTLNQPILVKRTPHKTFRFVGLDDSEDMIYSEGELINHDATPVLVSQLRWATIQPTGSLSILVTSAQYGDDFVPDIVSDEFDGTVEDTLTNPIIAPTNNNRVIFVLVQIDPTIPALSFKQTVEYNASIGIETAIKNGLMPTKDSDTKQLGFVRLTTGISAFGYGDIYCTPPFIDGSQVSAPFVDTTAIVKGSLDDTKQFRIEVDGFTAGQTRVATPPDEDFTMVGVATVQTPTNKTISASTNTLTVGAGVTKTISGADAVAAGADRNLICSANAGSTDNLIEVTGLAVGETVLLRATAGHTITVVHNSGSATVKIHLNGDTNTTLDEQNPLELKLIATNVLAQEKQFIASAILNNYAATAAPTANDDSGDGYSVGSRWFDVTNDKVYECIDATPTAAIWIEVVGRTQTQTLTGKTISASANTIGMGSGATKTLASDVCSAGTDRNIIVAAQSGVTDDLIEVTGLSVGESVLLRADAGDTITVKHNSGSATVKIYLHGNSDITLDEQNPLRLTLVDTNVMVEDVQNFSSIAGSAYHSYKSGSDYSTTSTTPVDVDATNVTLDISTSGGVVIVWFIFASRKGGGAGSGMFDIIENGATDSPNIERVVNLSGANTLIVVAARFSPAATTNTYKLRYWSTDGTQVIIDADLTIQVVAHEV